MQEAGLFTGLVGMTFGFYWTQRPDSKARVEDIHTVLKQAQRTINPDQKLAFTMKALEMTQNLNQTDDRVFDLYFCIAAQHERQENWFQARVYFTHALEHMKRQMKSPDGNHVLRHMVVLCRLGDTFVDDPKQTRAYYQQALALYAKHPEFHTLASFQMQHPIIRSNLQDLDETMSSWG